jgi:hypothetical protein
MPAPTEFPHTVLAHPPSTSLLSWWRVLSYPLELLWQGACYWLQRHGGHNTLKFLPLPPRLPSPWLEQHLRHSVRHNPAQVRHVLAQALHLQGSRASAHNVLAWLQCREIEQLIRQRRFAALVALRGHWLPGVYGAPPLLLAVREIARHLLAASNSHFPYQRIHHLRHAHAALHALHNVTLSDSSPLARHLDMIQPQWKFTLRRFYLETKASVQAEIPNPFHAGEPLTPECGREVFKGRHELTARLAQLLLDPHKPQSIALLGPRRCGKTSLLRMLPLLLPEMIWIFFDLQDNPIDAPSAFFRALVHRAQEQALREGGLNLPDLPPGPPLTAAAQWLETVDRLVAPRRMMLCFDEFERLEHVFLGDPRRLLQLMGLFRATIQHRRNLSLLVCGVAPLAELDSIWTDHFINLRELRIGHLKSTTALELLTRPVASFPAHTIPPLVAEAIVRRTGGQPYLLQLYGAYLVQLLNEQGRRQAQLADLKIVENRVLDESTYYFRNIFHSASADIQICLRALAHAHSVNLNARQQRWLRHRQLITAKGQLTIPVLARWIKELG